MNTYTNDCVGTGVILKDTNEEGTIVGFEYFPDLNHYRFKIEAQNTIYNLFEDEFMFI